VSQDRIELDSPDPESSGAIPSATLAERSRPSFAERQRARHTDREIARMAWPAILSQVLASAVSLIDIAMLGRLGTEALAAVGYATQYFQLAQAVLFAIGIAQVSMLARAIGSGDRRTARRLQGVFMALGAVACAVSVGAVAIAPRTLVLWLNATEEVATLAVPYFLLTMSSTLFLSVSLGLENGMRADRNTGTPMRIAVAVTVVKLALNFVLIFGALGAPELGLAGAGIATVVSQIAGMALFIAASRRCAQRDILAISAASLRSSRPLLAQAVRLATPALLERVFMNLALMTYFGLLGDYGPVAVATYTVGVRILSFSWIPGTGFSVAASTLVGQALGAGDVHSAARAGWRAARMGLIVSVALGLVFAFARTPLSRLFTNDAAVVEALGPFMLILALSQPLLGVHFTLGGALRGAGDTVTPLYAAILGNWGLRVPFAYLATEIFEAHVAWVWLALSLDHVARAIWLAIAFYRERWAIAAGLAPAHAEVKCTAAR
jgi:putative MATE family efflux protein